MKILKFQFENKATNWRLDEMVFDDFNLLVGASGVGKTQILQSLLILKDIASGLLEGNINIHCIWNITFETSEKNIYQWEGEYKQNFFDFSDLPRKFIFEKLFLNDNVVINRTQKRILFQGKQTPKLSQEKSVINILKEEIVIKPVYKSFDNIYIINPFIDTYRFQNEIPFTNVDTFISSLNIKFDKIKNKKDKLEEIRRNYFTIFEKLYFLKIAYPEIFNELKNDYINIFPQTEDVDIGISINFDYFNNNSGKFDIQIKEKGVKGWISQDKISSGMFKTFILLCELYLCSDDTIFLIDEFENGLGINCIDEITKNMLRSNRPLQFILTSHHPYIINAIPAQYWKLITRDGGVVKAQDMGKFNIGKSKHSAFMQLIQLEEYQTGQSSE